LPSIRAWASPQSPITIGDAGCGAPSSPSATKGFQDITSLTAQDLANDTPVYTVALDGDGTMQLEGGYVFMGLSGAPAE